MFVPDKTFKKIIIKSLRNDDKSISSIHRDLKEEGIEVHRLILTGYLRAMEDLHVLKAKQIPPSKVYSLPVTGEKDIYELVGECAGRIESPNEVKAAVAAYALQKIFRRPIFLEEIERTGFSAHLGSSIVKISNDDRLEVKKILNKRGLKIRYNDPAFTVKGEYENETTEILFEIISEKFRISNLVIDTKQTKLGV